MSLTLIRPERRQEPPAPALRPGQVKLCDPLAEWRPDLPDLWPHCADCTAAIRAGERYAVMYPNRVLCVPCSGLTVPRPLAARPRPVGVPSRVGAVAR